MSRLSLARLAPSGRFLAIAPPFLWLGLFLLLPFLLVLKISFADLAFGVPPYTPLVEIKDQAIALSLHLRTYALLFSDSLYIATYFSSVKMALVTTVQGLVAAIPLILAHSLLQSRFTELSNVLEQQVAGILAERAESNNSGMERAA